MEKYQITILVAGGKDGQLKAGQLAELIKALHGKPEKEVFVGQKILAYPIKKEGKADFYQINFEIDPANLSLLKKDIIQKGLVLRQLIIKPDK